jgi:antitoxin VapB
MVSVYTEAIMSEEHWAKVFKPGNSLALRLPKALGLVEGTEMTVREERSKFTFEPVEAPLRKIDLTGIAGLMPWLKPLTREERDLDMRPPRRPRCRN